MKVHITCKYCGHFWEKSVGPLWDPRYAECVKCHDKNLVVRDVADMKIDTYQGAPPFEEDKTNQYDNSEYGEGSFD